MNTVLQPNPHETHSDDSRVTRIISGVRAALNNALRGKSEIIEQVDDLLARARTPSTGRCTGPW